MSSWIIRRSVAPKKKATIVNYYDLSSSPDMPSLYLNYLSSYIYSQKMGESCVVWDPTSVLESTLRQPIQVKFLKDIPEEAKVISKDLLKPILAQLKFKELQKIAADILFYDVGFNRAVVNLIQKAGIKSMFDIGIHLVKHVSGPNLGEFKMYSDILKEYQKKTKLPTLSIYIMADNNSLITQFQGYCDPSWKITSLSKITPINSEEAFIQQMADIQIMNALPALALDFTRASDRFIYLMQRYNGGLTFFKEVKDAQWNLI